MHILALSILNKRVTIKCMVQLGCKTSYGFLYSVITDGPVTLSLAEGLGLFPFDKGVMTVPDLVPLCLVC